MEPLGMSRETASRCDADEAFLDHCIQYKVAESRDEREQAFALLYRAYRRDGLTAPHPSEMRITPFHLLPTTHLFVARYARNVISTLTLVEDGRLGLPLEEAYGKEVAERREAGLRLAEVSCLADRRRDFRRFLPVFLRLCGMIVQFSERRAIDQLLIAVHPRHARFYTRYMGFAQFGQERCYSAVGNAPAVALWMSPSLLRVENPAIYQRLVGRPVSAHFLRPRTMRPEDVAHFRRVMQLSQSGGSGTSSGPLPLGAANT